MAVREPTPEERDQIGGWRYRVRPVVQGTIPCRHCGCTERTKNRQCLQCYTEDSRKRNTARRIADPEKHRADARRWRENNKLRMQEYDRAKNLGDKYGISLTTYEKMEAGQNGLCAICQRTCKTGRRLAVDHDHNTKKVRALLCTKCNTAIGSFDHDPSLLVSAIRYLKDHQDG